MSVLLAPGPDAPAPETLVRFDYAASGTAPLDAFNAVRPLRVRHLSPFRARGPFAEALRAYPDSPRARLERIVLVNVEQARMTALKDVLARDRHVLGVHVMPLPVPISPVRGEVTPATPGGLTANPKSGEGSLGEQDFRDQLNIDQAWTNLGAEGWAHVAVIDSGIDPGHEDLRSTTTNTPPTLIPGGNWLSAMSFDLGTSVTDPNNPGPAPDWPDANVDEAEPVPASAGVPCATQLPNGSWARVPQYVGHGTHVSGLVAANAVNGIGVKGTCRHCGIQVLKGSNLTCVEDGPESVVVHTRTNEGLAFAYTVTGNVGTQVISASLSPALVPWTCDYSPNPNDPYSTHPYCLALRDADNNDIAVAGASGNQRHAILLPGSLPSVTAVGGTNELGTFWDEEPTYPPGAQCLGVLYLECGSNYTYPGYPAPQGHVARARNVLSTVYRGKDWNPAGRCGDGVFSVNPVNPWDPPPTNFLPGFPGDGYGHCTGTSMSAPQVAGILGILRSINPLVRVGNPFNSVDYGLRDVLAETSSLTTWDNRLGFGLPNAEAAARRMLGSVRPNQAVLNRVTPMFTMYSTGMTDVASTPSPQFAMALRRFDASYLSTGGAPGVPFPPLVPTYPHYPGEDYFPGSGPRANLYVLTTAKRPAGPESNPPLIPLYHMDRIVTSPPNCPPLTCPIVERDFMTVTTEAHVNAALAEGYAYMGRQGYVFAPCTTKGCTQPIGTLPLWRRCRNEATAGNPNQRDCALFLSDQDAAYQAAGYTQSFSAGSDPLIGYAYPAIDTDGDGLVDGMEHVIGTSSSHTDSDFDGIPDGVEFPMTGVSQLYACDKPGNVCN